jgi:hypothetical protein
MVRIQSNPGTETPVWSAHNLPKAKATRMQSFSVLAVAVGLVVIVLASAVKNPIQTTGSKMEPTRHIDTALKADTAKSTAIVVAASLN